MSRDSIVLTDSLLQAYIDDDVEVKAGQSAEEERARGAGPTIRPGFDAIAARSSSFTSCCFSMRVEPPRHPPSPSLIVSRIEPRDTPSFLAASPVISPSVARHSSSPFIALGAMRPSQSLLNCLR